jgi:hypothetical protein
MTTAETVTANLSRSLAATIAAHHGRDEQQQEREREMFGCTIADLAETVRENATDALMAAASMLSDGQEQLVRGDAEAARQTMNRAKWILFEVRAAVQNRVRV